MTAVRVTSLTESPAIPIEMTAATPATPATSISHWRLEQGFNWAIFAVVVVVVVVVVAVAAVASFHFHLTRWCPLARLNRWLKAPGARLLFRRRRIVNMAIMAPIIQWIIGWSESMFVRSSSPNSWSALMDRRSQCHLPPPPSTIIDIRRPSRSADQPAAFQRHPAALFDDFLNVFCVLFHWFRRH